MPTVFLGAVAVTVAATWPLALHLFDLSRVSDRTLDDSIFYWNFAWFYRALFELGTNPFFCGEIFHPYGASLASSPLGAPFCLVSLPFQAALGRLAGSVVALKLIAFCSFPLAVHGTSLCLRAHRVPPAAAFLAGCLFAFAPFHLLNLVRLHYLAGWTLPYFLWSLTLAGRSGSLAWIAGAGALFATAGACDASLLPLLVLAAAGLAWVLWKEGVGLRSVLARLLGSGVFGAVLLAPLLVPGLRSDAATDMLEELAFEASPDRYQSLFSPDLGALLYYVSPAAHVALAGDDRPTRDSSERRIQNIHRSFRPPSAVPWSETLGALIVIALVLAATLLGLRRRTTWPFAVLAGLAFLLSLGPYRSVGGDVVRMPYYYLAELVPGMKAGRYVVANLRLFQFAVAVVAGVGLARAPRWLSHASWTALGICALAWISRPLRFVDVAPERVHELMAADPVPGAVLDVPQGLATREMALGQIVHGRPLMDGPIHRHPAEALRFYEEVPVVRRLLDCEVQLQLGEAEIERTTAENVRLLREHGVRYIVVRHAGRHPRLLARLPAYLARHPGIELVFTSNDVLLARVGSG